MPEICKDLKGQLLKTILSSSKVFITGHNEPDFDSISSAIGIERLCEELGKDAYIIVDDCETTLEPSVKKIIDNGRRKYNIIKLPEFLSLIDSDSSLVVVDANKDYQLSVSAYLPAFKSRIIIDHHNPDSHTINATYSYINPSVSSAAEVVARVLNAFSIPYDSEVANYLLAGIELDTNRYKKNTTSITHDVAEKLIDKGASTEFVKRLVLAEFETDCRINNLVYNGSLFEKYEKNAFQYRQASFTLNRTAPTTIYKKEDLAKAADRMLDYNVDVAFALGFVKEDLISVSARSKSDINVGEIMEEFDGGGNAQSAACKIPSTDILTIEEQLKSAVKRRIISPNKCQAIAMLDHSQYVKVKK